MKIHGILRTTFYSPEMEMLICKQTKAFMRNGMNRLAEIFQSQPKQQKLSNGLKQNLHLYQPLLFSHPLPSQSSQLQCKYLSVQLELEGTKKFMLISLNYMTIVCNNLSCITHFHQPHRQKYISNCE